MKIWVRLMIIQNKKKKVDLPVVYQNLDNEIKSLCEHIEELKKISDKCYQEAKENLKTNDKKGAQTTLVKKKRYDKQINYFEESLELLEQQKMILEKLMILKKIFNTTIETNEAIKAVNEISESIQNQNEDTLGKVDDNLEQKNKKKKWIYLVCQNLDKEINTICERIEELEKIANKYQIEADAKLNKKDKDGAQKDLTKKKRYEKQINDYRVPLELLKQQKMILENFMMKKQIFKPVKETNETMKEAHETMKIKTKLVNLSKFWLNQNKKIK